jgi:UDP-N-acetyl-D-mannosaminuronate dehydrogenase
MSAMRVAAASRREGKRQDQEAKALNANRKVVVVGLGEIGKPLCELFSKHRDVVGVDLSPVGPVDNVEVLHICYPFQIPDFIGETVRYVRTFRPELTIINSTVAVGTTRAIAERTASSVVSSPVRGKHARMLDDMRMYTKFVGAIEPDAGQKAVEHFQSAGLKTRLLASPEATELAKLTETTYFGVMIAWAQEVERFCDRFGQDYEDVVSFYDEIKFFPTVKYFPGVIGGHCVMSNIEILSKTGPSPMLTAIQASNQAKVERGSGNQAAVEPEPTADLTKAI